MRSTEDQMMVDDYDSEGSTEEMLSGDEGESEEAQSSSLNSCNSFETFSSFSLYQVTRYDSFSSSTSGSDSTSLPLQKAQSLMTGIPIFKEPFNKQQKKDPEEGLTPPVPQSPPSDGGYLNTSPYRTPPKRSLSSSCGNLYNTAEAERLRTNLSERFKTGGGTCIQKREKIRTRLPTDVNFNVTNENASPNLSGRSALLRSQTLPVFTPYAKPSLPIISNSDECQRISAETLIKTMQKSFEINYIILDCRYDFEFEGGHIFNAIHCPPARCEEILRERFINNPIKEKIAIIFHCEFSSKRGPSAYKELRKLDRSMNTYPNLTYPDMYVLDGGYREFFYAHPQYCYPNGYIEMKDKSFKKQLQICESERKKGKASKIYRFGSGHQSNLNLRHSSNSFHI